MKKNELPEQEQQDNHEQLANKNGDSKETKRNDADQSVYPEEDDAKKGSSGNEEKDITV